MATPNTTNVPSSILPLPPLEYDVQYMNLLVRVLNFFIQQQGVPGVVRGTELQLAGKDPDSKVTMRVTAYANDITEIIFTELPTSATGLKSGQLWRDTATNILHIVP